MTQGLMGVMGKAKPSMLVSSPISCCGAEGGDAHEKPCVICVAETAVVGFHGAFDQVKPD